MTSISFFVAGIPKAQPRPRAFARMLPGGKAIARVYEAGTAEGWKSAIAIAAKPFIPATPLEGPIQVNISFYFPRPKAHFRKNGELKPESPAWHTGRPDRDNLDKAVLDALTTLGIWKDDGQVCAGMPLKLYAPPGHPSGATIKVTPIADLLTLDGNGAITTRPKLS
jgi:Holliday junction resolvase RusA-like endonuclease